MARELAPVDISTMPDLARLAEEVRSTGTPRRLRRGGEDVAILSPARPRRRTLKGKTVTQADIDAVMALAGAWKGQVDTEQLKRDLDAARSDGRPPVEL